MSAAPPAERPSTVDRPEPAPVAAPARAREPWAWGRLLGLLLVAAATELVYVAFWPVSYYLTQGVDFIDEYTT